VWHRFVAKEGYTAASFDNHVTPAPRGHEWCKIVYGDVCVLSSKEQVAALQKFEQTYSFVDSARVAVWGWSGGGSNTLNLMFRSPDVYKVGMSVAPVADQRLYDSIYQERYMGLPQQNANGYKMSSAINFAEGLRGDLLIVHTPDDDNVHFQNSIQMINALINAGKPFRLMVYPNKTHSIAGKDARVHLFTMILDHFERELKPSTAQAGGQ